MHIEDREILDLLGAESTREAGFLHLVNKYQRRLYYHIRRFVFTHEDADDILQNTFIKAWTGISRFREESQLYTWLYRVSTNEALTFLKRQRRRDSISLDEAGTSWHPASEAMPTGEEVSRMLFLAVIQLPPKQQAVFNLRYFEDLTYEEISGIMGTSVGALKASYHHAVKKIEKKLGEI